MQRHCRRQVLCCELLRHLLNAQVLVISSFVNGMCDVAQPAAACDAETLSVHDIDVHDDLVTGAKLHKQTHHLASSRCRNRKDRPVVLDADGRSERQAGAGPLTALPASQHCNTAAAAPSRNCSDGATQRVLDACGGVCGCAAPAPAPSLSCTDRECRGAAKPAAQGQRQGFTGAVEPCSAETALTRLQRRVIALKWRRHLDGCGRAATDGANVICASLMRGQRGRQQRHANVYDRDMPWHDHRQATRTHTF